MGEQGDVRDKSVLLHRPVGLAREEKQSELFFFFLINQPPPERNGREHAYCLIIRAHLASLDGLTTPSSLGLQPVIFSWRPIHSVGGPAH